MRHLISVARLLGLLKAERANELGIGRLPPAKCQPQSQVGGLLIREYIAHRTTPRRDDLPKHTHVTQTRFGTTVPLAG